MREIQCKATIVESSERDLNGATVYDVDWFADPLDNPELSKGTYGKDTLTERPIVGQTDITVWIEVED